jgi:acyl-CoA synthetase (AMP-forming)/AMP-acid ligase II
VAEIQSMYGIEPGGIDLACFPLFALFNAAMGVTTVFPEMDFSHPASADPRKLLAAANVWRVTQAFASPAVWRVVGEHCARTGEKIDSLRQVFSCGAPVSADVLRHTLACVAPSAKMHTPYGATECLPVSTIEAAEVIGETAARTDEGAGVCVGKKVDSIDWRVIRIKDEPIATIGEAEELRVGEIGELIVRGVQVSPQYVTQAQANALAKIEDNLGAEYLVRNAQLDSALPSRRPFACFDSWHRTGDVGYIDEEGRFWYCGRKSQRVETRNGPLFTECVEGVANTYAGIKRSALVGIKQGGELEPVLIVESDGDPNKGHWNDVLLHLTRISKGRYSIDRVMALNQLPVDVRHNAKINREKLAAWAARFSETP